MVRYASRALPWALIGISSALVFCLIELTGAYPWTLWPLQGIAVGLIAAVSAWCQDERAAAVVDAAPRGLAWRSAARATGTAVLLIVWTASVLRQGDALFAHPIAVLVQGFCAAVLGSAWAIWRRARGETSPGYYWAMVAVPAAAAWALVRPLERRLPVFPYAAEGPTAQWPSSTAGWLVAAGVAGLVIAVTLSRPGLTLPRPSRDTQQKTAAVSMVPPR